MSDPMGGRELDAMIAEKVFGWSAFDRSPWRGEFAFADITLVRPGRPQPRSIADVFANVQAPPKYSTDIASAFSVVEKMRERGLTVHMDTLGFMPGPWRVWLLTEECDRVADGEGELPLAICLAALDAVRDKWSGASTPEREKGE